jgi:iron(III) transport system substrate-binding protein
MKPEDRRMRSKHPTARLVAIAATAALLLTACGGSPTSPGGQDRGAAANVDYTELAKLPVDELAKRAEKEEQLDLYTSMTADVADEVVGAFEDEYDITVNLYRASSETVLQRILQEQQANFRGNDIVETNATEMFALEKEGFLAPYSGAPRDTVAKGGLFPAWTATRFNIFAPSWNTKLVKQGEQPKSWEELADPKWKGKISMEVSDYDWFLTLHGYWVKQGKSSQEAEQLFRTMARNAKIVKGHTVQGELLSAGQFAVAASNYTYLTQRLADKGAPVAYRPTVEPVIARPNGVGLMKTAKHPAAALLFTNWILTKGQDTLVEAGITPSVEGKEAALKDAEVIPVDVKALAEENKKWSDLYQSVVSEGEQVKEE